MFPDTPSSDDRATPDTNVPEPLVLELSTLSPYVTTRTAAKIWQCSEATIRRAVSRGEIKAVRLGPRLLRIETASLFAAATPVIGAK